MQMKKYLFMGIVVCSFLQATIIHVPSDQPTIQSGIYEAIVGDTVLVAPGVYLENINFNGKNIFVCSYALIENNDYYVDQTIIKPENDIYSCIVFETNETHEATLFGFTLLHNDPTLFYDGFLIYCSNTSPTIMNNKIINSFCGISLNQSHAIIRENIFYMNNEHPYLQGIAIITSSSTAIIEMNKFYSGWGIKTTNSTNLIRQNILTGCIRGVTIESSHDIFLFNTIVYNTDITYGFGLEMTGDSSPILINNVIFGNSYDTHFSFLNYPVFAFNCIGDGFPEQGIDGGGNIYENPILSNPENGNYSLQQNSPCIDAGTAFFVWEGDTIVNMSEDEYCGTAPDMGAYESNYTVGIDNSFLDVPKIIMLSPAYPNPFNPITTISFTIPQNNAETLRVGNPDKIGAASLMVYDITGRLVETLVNEKLEPGQHAVKWDATGFSSGVYFSRLTRGNQHSVRKLILLK